MKVQRDEIDFENAIVEIKIDGDFYNIGETLVDEYKDDILKKANQKIFAAWEKEGVKIAPIEFILEVNL